MADLYPAEPAEALNDVQPAAATEVNAEKATLFGTLAHLWPYIWPGDRADLKMAPTPRRSSRRTGCCG